jgi:hypothetical protein
MQSPNLDCSPTLVETTNQKGGKEDKIPQASYFVNKNNIHKM